jgi:cytidylate kinase
MIICLFGASLVGKTTVARSVSSTMGLPLRSCGSIVRAEAAESGVRLADLSDEDHKRIDSQTIAWALKQNSCLIEGRFLDAVFGGTDQLPIMIKLMATDECRVQRGRVRNGKSTFSVEDIRRLDAEDAVFRARMFGAHPTVVSRREVDTSGLSVDVCAHTIENLIEAAILDKLD